MKQTIFILIIFLSYALGQQSICGLEGGKPDSIMIAIANQKINTNSKYIVRVFCYIVRRSNGTGGVSYQTVYDALNVLQTDYEPHGICFSLLGIEEIWDDSLYNGSFLSNCSSAGCDFDDDGKFDLMPNQYNHPNAIDIYFVGPIDQPMAAAVISTAFALNIFYPNTSVISHEMGHCLGLYHTYHGTCTPYGVPEDPNGSNCAIAGDYICDTPADNTIVFSHVGPCVGNSREYVCRTDKPYNPRTDLIMDRLPVHCLKYFTPQQVDMMKSLLQTHTRLQPIKVPDDLTLNPLTVNNGETKLYDVVNKLEAYNLTVNPGASLTLRAGKRIVIGPNTHIKKGSYFRAYIDTVCSTIDAFNSARAEQVKTKPKETEAKQKIFVYPNPTTRFLYIETPYELTYKIYNVLGNKMKEGIATAGKNKINVSDLSVGVYVIKLGNGKLKEVLKFVKIE